MENIPHILDRVKGNALFHGVDIQSVFDLIADGVYERVIQPGEMVFKESSREGVLFLIVEGRIQIRKMSKTGEEVVVAILHSGEFFGELGVLDNKPRSASAFAIDRCVLAAIPKPMVELLLTHSNSVTVNLMRTLSNRLRSTDFAYVREYEQSSEQLQRQLSQMQLLIEAARILNSSLDLDQLLTLNLEMGLRLINADRGTLYLIDETKQELWSKVLKASEIIEIRLPLGKGIAGHVAQTGKIYNNNDVYNDPKFETDIDKKSGYHTKSMLCVPLKEKSGKIGRAHV